MAATPPSRAHEQPEAVVRAFLTLLAEDPALAVDLLSPEVEWRNTGLPTVRGDAVRQALLTAAKARVHFAVDLHEVRVDGAVVHTDRHDELGLGPVRSRFRVRGDLTVEDGLVTVWDDHFNWVEAYAGSVPATVEGLVDTARGVAGTAMKVAGTAARLLGR